MQWYLTANKTVWLDASLTGLCACTVGSTTLAAHMPKLKCTRVNGVESNVSPTCNMPYKERHAARAKCMVAVVATIAIGNRQLAR